MPGLYFEEFTVGQTFKHGITRTITEADNVWFSALTRNPAPLHLDAEYMKNSEFGQRIVNSCLTLAFMVGISVGDTTVGTTVANLGWDEVRFPKTVISWRHDSHRHGSARSKGQQITPGKWHRDFCPPCLQPARCAGRRVHALGTHVAEAQVSRRFLFIPADSEHKLGKAATSGADAIIVDLEDSVAAAASKSTRSRIP